MHKELPFPIDAFGRRFALAQLGLVMQYFFQKEAREATWVRRAPGKIRFEWITTPMLPPFYNSVNICAEQTRDRFLGKLRADQSLTGGQVVKVVGPRKAGGRKSNHKTSKEAAGVKRGDGRTRPWNDCLFCFLSYALWKISSPPVATKSLISVSLSLPLLLQQTISISRYAPSCLPNYFSSFNFCMISRDYRGLFFVMEW